jgi:hypothetical protein
MSNYTTTPAGGDRVQPAPPGESRDDLAAADREARLAELTLERFTPYPMPTQRPAHRSECSAIRHVERRARRARQAADLAGSGTATSFQRGPRHRTDNLSEAGR